VEGHRSGLAGLIALVLVLGMVPSADAAEDDVHGAVDPSGVTITIVRWQGSDRVLATGSGGGGDPTGCDWAVVPAPLGAWPPADLPPWRPDSYLGLLTCDGVGVEVIWVGPHNTVDLEAEARRLVEAYVARVPVPDLDIHTSPPTTGLVGLESWFWATGWDGRAIVDRIDALGVGVDVRIDPTPIAWDFGDGHQVTGGLGEPSPARSSVRHGYTQHGRPVIGVGVDLIPRYRIDGTDWIELPAIEVRATRPYRVVEAQAVVTG
jgi:hypothetical protein